MWMPLLYAAAVGVLLFSNAWMLRELENLKRQLEAYRQEVASLDDRVCQLMYTVEAAGTAQAGCRPPSPAASPGGR